MVNEIILSWFEIRRRRKVDPKVLAGLLDVIVTPRQSNDIRVEFCHPKSALATGGRIDYQRDKFGVPLDHHGRDHR